VKFSLVVVILNQLMPRIIVEILTRYNFKTSPSTMTKTIRNSKFAIKEGRSPHRMQLRIAAQRLPAYLFLA